MQVYRGVFDEMEGPLFKSFDGYQIKGRVEASALLKKDRLSTRKAKRYM